MRDLIADDEYDRLRDLYHCAILDTEPETEYDFLCKLAADLCDCPVALITFIDEERTWLKAQKGTALVSIPRAESYCQYTIRGTDPLLIQDTLVDERTKAMRLSTQPNAFRFYVGIPLRAVSGLAIGTLCLLDYKPRLLTSEKIQTLQDLATQIVALIELRRAKRIFIEEWQAQLKAEEALLRLTSELSEAKRLSALGFMSIEIAHEINSPLSVIMLNAELLNENRTGSHTPHELQESIQQIRTSADAIRSLVRRMRTVGRFNNHEQAQSISLLEVINDVADACRARLRKEAISLEINCHAGFTAHVCSAHLAQVLLNLFTNSVEALNDQIERWIKISVHEDVGLISIRFSDSGHGISPEHSAKIMQPFFTTKPNGIGIGLDISQRLIQQNGGRLWLDTEAASTTFVISLPIVGR